MSLANFMQPLDLPKDVEHWSLTTPRKKPVKSGAKVVSHERYVNFQMAEVAVPRELFRKTLRLIDGLRPRPSPASAGSEAKSTGAVCLDEGKMEEIGLMWGDTPPMGGYMAAPDRITGPMNLGNTVNVTMLDLAEKIIAMTGARSGIDYKPLPQDDPLRRQPDISFAKNTLGWELKVPLEQGLDRTISYFRRLLST